MAHLGTEQTGLTAGMNAQLGLVPQLTAESAPVAFTPTRFVTEGRLVTLEQSAVYLLRTVAELQVRLAASEERELARTWRARWLRLKTFLKGLFRA